MSLASPHPPFLARVTRVWGECQYFAVCRGVVGRCREKGPHAIDTPDQGMQQSWKSDFMRLLAGCVCTLRKGPLNYHNT